MLVAMRPEDFAYFAWPEPRRGLPPPVGETLQTYGRERLAAAPPLGGERANDIAPTIVGGSKKHGGADLGRPGRSGRGGNWAWTLSAWRTPRLRLMIRCDPAAETDV